MKRLQVLIMENALRVRNVLLITGVMVLLAAWLYNICGYYVVFQVNRYQVRSEMKQQMKQGGRKVTVLTIFDVEKDPHFRRIHSREFEFNGQMFDVLREVKNGRITTFYCLHDTKEESLMLGMRKAARTKAAQNLIHSLITVAMPVSYSANEIPVSRTMVFPPLERSLLFRPSAPPSPPPKPMVS